MIIGDYKPGHETFSVLKSGYGDQVESGRLVVTCLKYRAGCKITDSSTVLVLTRKMHCFTGNATCDHDFSI